MMALTATATVTTRKAICKTLGMLDSVVVAESPNKPNIKYSVQHNPGTLEETFAPLVEKIRSHRQSLPRSIIFCRSYDSCSSIYLFMKSRLGREMTEPMGTPDLPRFRLKDMFTWCTRLDIKESIIGSFCDPHRQLRVVISTVAFGMGLDCPNVGAVINWVLAEDAELYLQETGRAGRDGLPANAVLYHGGPDLITRNVYKDIKDYCGNKDICRRRLLLGLFHSSEEIGTSPQFPCCDVCDLL